MKWLKIWIKEVLRGSTFQELTLEERGLWFSLLCMAGDNLKPGYVEMRNDVGYPVEVLAPLLNCEVAIISEALKRLKQVGKIEIDSNNVIKISNWEKYQSEYQRQKKYRIGEKKEKQKQPDKKVEKKREKKNGEFELFCNNLVDFWNKNIPIEISKITKLSKRRKEKLETRYEENKDIEIWKKAIIKMGKSSFCRGNNNREWIASFNWLIKNEDNLLNLLEGNYDSKMEKSKVVGYINGKPITENDIELKPELMGKIDKLPTGERVVLPEDRITPEEVKEQIGRIFK